MSFLLNQDDEDVGIICDGCSLSMMYGTKDCRDSRSTIFIDYCEVCANKYLGDTTNMRVKYGEP